MKDEIIEGNKLIAEFDGWRLVKGREKLEYYKHKDYSLIHKPTDWKYHSSWDWQIPVWSKIAKAVKELLPNHHNAENEARMFFRQADLYEKSVFNNKPEDGQKIIVELIKWYNQTKK